MPANNLNSDQLSRRRPQARTVSDLSSGTPTGIQWGTRSMLVGTFVIASVTAIWLHFGAGIGIGVLFICSLLGAHLLGAKLGSLMTEQASIDHRQTSNDSIGPVESPNMPPFSETQLAVEVNCEADHKVVRESTSGWRASFCCGLPIGLLCGSALAWSYRDSVGLSGVATAIVSCSIIATILVFGMIGLTRVIRKLVSVGGIGFDAPGDAY